MAVNTGRVLVGLTFIFSGYVKAIDPLGTQYKIADYLQALGLAGFLPDWLTLAASVALSTLELSLGILLLFGIRRRLVTRLLLVVMLIMTAVTLWIAIANPVKDCGCFGDAVKLTNLQTLAKNVVLLVLVAIMWRMPLYIIRCFSRPTQWIVINYTILFSILLSAWSLWYLPLFDFRPYHVGTDINKGMEIPKGAEQPQFETTFILEKNGEKKEFTLDNYPDSTWKFIDSKTVQTSEGYVPPIHDFSIEDPHTGEDITQQVLRDPGYTFVLVSPSLGKADDANFGTIDQIYEYAQDYGYRFICLTASDDKEITRWQEMTGAEYPFYTTDATTLKTIIRSNPGLVLLHRGVIVRKWSHNDLPSEEELKVPLEESKLGRIPANNATGKIVKVLMWFFLPLILLTIADRLFTWTAWIKKKNSNKIFSTFKKEKKNEKENCSR